nr:uncharacterized protein LOC109733208 [Aegilops tauschii subsp. strangulata]
MCTKEMPTAEVAYLVKEIADLKLEPEGWRFGKRPYSRVDPPPMVLPLQPEANVDFLPDRDASDVADPDLGAAALEDEATCGPRFLLSGRPQPPSSGRRRVPPIPARIDPAADLREAQERNAREVREEKEVATKQAEADKAAQADADAAAQAQADAAAMEQVEDILHWQIPQLITPLRSALPAPEFLALAGGAGDEQPVMEREGGDAVLPEIEDYHNIRAATFYANIRELDRRTTDLAESRKANAALQQQLGEANTALRAKEDECSKAVQERDRLAKELKDQAELHKAALKQAADNEAWLLAEFETERIGWAETKATSSPAILLPPTRPLRLAARNEGRKAWRSLPTPLGPLEAGAELVAVERDLTLRAAAIAECTNTGVFVPELNENGAEAPPVWFGLNTDDGEDWAEVIDSSDEGEDEEDEDDEDGTPEVGADGQSQLDRTSSNEPRASTSTVVEGNQAETRQPATPPAGAPDSTNLPDSPAAPLV